jgi:site-specific DNA recombinase
VICFKFDRITRSIRDFIEIWEFLAEHDVAIISIREDIDSSGIVGELALKILMVIAEFERRQVAERTIAIMEDRVGRGLRNGGVVYGYISDPKQPGKLLVDPEWAHLLLAERLSTCRSA